MEILRTTSPAECMRFAGECLAGHEGAIIHTCIEPFIITGQKQGTFDADKCRELGVYIATGQYVGGTVVCFPGDLSISITTWGNSDVGKRITDRAAEWLSEKGVAVTRDANDVLADGKKVISWARATTIKGWCQSSVHFSVNVDVDLIRSICTKPMVKTPGALSDYGITAGQILDVIGDLIPSEEGAT